MQTDGQICNTEVVTVRAARSWSNVNWDMSSSIVEKGLLVQHMIFHLIPCLTNSALQQMTLSSKSKELKYGLCKPDQKLLSMRLLVPVLPEEC